jgi:hypothetical protein
MTRASWQQVKLFLQRHAYAPWRQLSWRQRLLHVTNLSMKAMIVTLSLAVMAIMSVLTFNVFKAKSIAMIMLLRMPLQPTRVPMDS